MNSIGKRGALKRYWKGDPILSERTLPASDDLKGIRGGCSY